MSTAEQEAAEQQGLSEQEPLLGRVGDASQQADKPMYYNLVLGTAIIAQAGVWLLAGVIWGSVLSKKINLFAAHPVCFAALLRKWFTTTPRIDSPFSLIAS